MKSEALKGISIASVEETVDQAMEHLPQSVDLSLPENRRKIRDWMVRICGVITQRNVDTFTKAAKSAIDEAGALAIDPHYHQRMFKRREQRKAKVAARQQTEQMSQEQSAFASIKEGAKPNA
jgi:hypothetical protein